MFQTEMDGLVVSTRILKAIVSSIVAVFMIQAISCSGGNHPPSARSNTSSVTSTIKKGIQGGASFEGSITMKIATQDRKNLGLTYFIKGDRSRIESNFNPNSNMQSIMLWDTSAGKLTTLMPKKKIYMTMDLNEKGEGLGDTSKEEEKSGNERRETQFPKLTATGKQEIIAGYPCEHWLMGEKQETDMCVAKGLGYFGMGSKLGGLGPLKNFLFNPKSLTAATSPPEWVKLIEGGAFPLKVTQTEDGQVRMNMEASRIERQKLDDVLFAVPTDYKELKIPNSPER